VLTPQDLRREAAGIYEVSFTHVAYNRRRMTSAVVETDPGCHRRVSDDYDRLLLELIVSTTVLGEPADDLRVEFSNLTAAHFGTPDLRQQAMKHSVLGIRPDRAARSPHRGTE
jgi:hypothetical protein